MSNTRGPCKEVPPGIIQKQESNEHQRINRTLMVRNTKPNPMTNSMMGSLAAMASAAGQGVPLMAFSERCRWASPCSCHAKQIKFDKSYCTSDCLGFH